MKPNWYRPGIVFCLLVLLGGSILHTLVGTSNMAVNGLHTWGTDDSYIGYRYAKNLSDGQGLVFNPGERVEAYSDVLYVLLMVPAFWVTNTDGVYFFSVFLNLVFAGVAFLIFVADLHRRLGPRCAVAGGLLLAVCLPLWVAVSSGLETPLPLAASVAVWVLAERVASEPTPRGISLWCLAMFASLLARADGFIICGFALVYLLLKRRFRAFAIGAALVALTLGAFEIWRYAYYGYLFPNTYYNKVSGPMGPRITHAWQQLSTIAVVHGLLPYLLIVPFVLSDKVRKVFQGGHRLAAEIRFDLLFPLLWVAYWFYIGGDHFWDRFLIVLYPLGIFALLEFLSGSAHPKVLGFVVLVLAMLELIPPFKADPRFEYRFAKHDGWIVAGKFIGKQFPGKTLATVTIGKIPFFSGLHTDDILGLSDPVLAHRPVNPGRFDPGHVKYDPDYTLSRKPDLIADWIHAGLNLPYGLTRTKYENAGYQIRYLVYTNVAPGAQDILSVDDSDAATIEKWVARGYEFAILVRQ